MRSDVKKKRRKKSRIIFNTVIFILFVTVLGLGLFSHFFLNRFRLIGEWYRSVDVTDTVTDNAKAYLNENNIPQETDLDRIFGEIRIKSKLVISSDGSFVERIDEASYADADRKVKEAFEQIVIQILDEKIEEVYINTDVSTEDLILQATGMDLSTYLEKYGPQLLPSLEELNGQSAISAQYIADRDTILINEEGKEQDCEYAIADNVLAIDYDDAAAIYYSIKDTEQKSGD